MCVCVCVSGGGGGGVGECVNFFTAAEVTPPTPPPNYAVATAQE